MTDLLAAFVEVLDSERDALNARFALRQRSGSRIDGGAFLHHLEQHVAPLAGQVQATLPERTRNVVTSLYDVSLDLFAASLLGPEAKLPWVERAWTDVLPVAIHLLARHPQQVAGSLCNAAFQIASQQGARPHDWLARMQHVAPHCQSVNELLAAGQVAAWQAGMVQYREAALATAGKLRTPLAALALGLPESISPDEMTAILGRLSDHLWFTATAARVRPREPAIACVATAGAFSGFGGQFFRPPTVSCEGQRLLVSDGRSQWQLIADAYGSWLRRIGDAPAKRPGAAGKKDPAIDREGTILWGQLSLETPATTSSIAVPSLSQASSFAASGQTLAVTIPTSHHVFLFSYGGPA